MTFDTANEAGQIRRIASATQQLVVYLQEEDLSIAEAVRAGQGGLAACLPDLGRLIEAASLGMKWCPVCGEQHDRRALYCSRDCQVTAYNIRRRAPR